MFDSLTSILLTPNIISCVLSILLINIFRMFDDSLSLVLVRSVVIASSHKKVSVWKPIKPIP